MDSANDKNKLEKYLKLNPKFYKIWIIFGK